MKFAGLTVCLCLRENKPLFESWVEKTVYLVSLCNNQILTGRSTPVITFSFSCPLFSIRLIKAESLLCRRRRRHISVINVQEKCSDPVGAPGRLAGNFSRGERKVIVFSYSS